MRVAGGRQVGRFAGSVRSQPGLAGAFFIDAVGTGMFIPFSLLFFLTTTSLSLTQIGLGMSLAAIVRIPVTIAAGSLSDRFGPRTAIIASQLLQAAGYFWYLDVHSFWELIAAAVLIQVGNSIFWVAYAPMIVAVAPKNEREHWFALCSALQTAGIAAGGVIAGATVAAGGRAGFYGVTAVNAASFLVAAYLTVRLKAGGTGVSPASASVPGSGGSLLRDYPFLGFVGVNVGITFLAMAPVTALPVFLVKTIGLPAWTPGVTLALSAILQTLSAPVVMAAMAGRRRNRVLTATQTLLIGVFGAFLLARLLPTLAAIILVLAAVVPLAACTAAQAAVVPAVVTDSATPQTLGRYTATFQLTFCVADIIVPAIVTAALNAGAIALWAPMAAVALIDLAAVNALARRMPALTHSVGDPQPEPNPVS